MVSEADTYFDRRAKALVFLRLFFDALARRDWPTVEKSFHPSAALFTESGSGLPAFQHWDAMASILKRWLELPGIRKLSVRLDDLEFQVSDGSAIVSLPRARNRRDSGERCIILTWDGDGWLIRHLHLSRIGIDLVDLAAN